MNTDVKFLKSQVPSAQDNVINQEKNAASFKTESFVDTGKDVVSARLEKKFSKKEMEIKEKSVNKVISDDVDIKKCKKEGPPLEVSFGKKIEAMSTTNIGMEALPHTVFNKRCYDSTSNQDLTKRKNLSHADFHMKIKEERGINESDVKEQILKDEYSVKSQVSDVGLDRGINKPEVKEQILKNECGIKREVSDVGFDRKYNFEFESYRFKEFAGMNLEEKYKKEKSDMEFEEKCRREAAADDVKSEDTSLDEDFDEDFEDQYYDDEFSDQYMELDQLSFNKGEHEQQNQIQEILNKYSTVISTSQNQDEVNGSLEGANPSLPLTQENAANEQKDFVKKSPDLLKKKETNLEIGGPYRDIQFSKFEEPKISEQTDGPLGHPMGQDDFSLVMKPQKNKSKDISCIVCNKKLSSNYTLKNHMLLHTGEKPFNCDHCEVAFVRKPQLVSHLNRAHGIN